MRHYSLFENTETQRHRENFVIKLIGTYKILCVSVPLCSAKKEFVPCKMVHANLLRLRVFAFEIRKEIVGHEQVKNPLLFILSHFVGKESPATGTFLHKYA